MTTGLAERFAIIDADTHISEPPDLWTSRISTARWGDLVPHVKREEDGSDRWYFGKIRSYGVAQLCVAGWDGFMPDHPETLADGDPGCYLAKQRLERMDEYGIHAQVLYPNVIGFSAQHFMGLKEPELMLLCVQAYNDFLVEWSAEAPDRFIPIMALPFWDLEASVAEIKRSKERGHLGILFGCEFQNFGLPQLGDRYWDPIWTVAQDLELSINFHSGSGGRPAAELDNPPEGYGRQAMYAKVSTTMFMGNGRGIAETIMSGICHRFPGVNFVSVESGVGWIPFLLEALDWQWLNSGCRQEHPDRDLPSEYFRRQIYGCFWFESNKDFLYPVLETFSDNMLFETDYPHPTSLSPGPASTADIPRKFVDDALGDLPEATARKVLHDNAARVYHLD